MHKDTLNFVFACKKTQFIITISTDGFIKFWKKIYIGIEFVKSFRTHSGRVCGAALSLNE